MVSFQGLRITSWQPDKLVVANLNLPEHEEDVEYSVYGIHQHGAQGLGWRQVVAQA